MANRCCVVVPFFQDRISLADIWEIGRLVRQRDETVQWKPVPNRNSRQLAPFRQPSVPAMLLQFHGIVQRLALPQFKGPRIACIPVNKAEQLKRLEAAGLPVPPWTMLEPDARVDPGRFGDYLIVKSTEARSSLGRGLSLIRTSDFESFRDARAPALTHGGDPLPVIQKFVRTGDNARHYRIITFMGRIIHSAVLENVAPTPFGALSEGGELTEAVASNTGERRGWLFEDDELFALARQVAGVFASPVIGIDFVRCAQTGQAFVLEANMGNVWLFSSRLGTAARDRLGINAVKAQHDAFAVVADAIVERAHRELGPR